MCFLLPKYALDQGGEAIWLADGSIAFNPERMK
jgi:hypothetical protein